MVFLVVVPPTQQALHTSDSGGPIYTSLADAVKVCRSGDVVLLSPGQHVLDTPVIIDQKISVMGIGPREHVSLVVANFLEAGLCLRKSGVVVSNLSLRSRSSSTKECQELSPELKEAFQRSDFFSSLVMIHLGCDEISVTHCTLDCDFVCHMGISVSGECRGITLSNIEVSGASAAGVCISQGSVVDFSISRVSECLSGVFIKDEDSVCKLSHVDVLKCLQGGVLVKDSATACLHLVRLMENDRAAVCCTEESKCIISSCTIQNNDYGVVVADGSDCSVELSDLLDQKSVDVDARGQGSRVFVTKTALRRCEDRSILVYDGAELFVTTCEIDSSAVGMHVSGGGTLVAMSESRIKGCKEHGVVATDGCDPFYVVISRCDVCEMGSNGILVDDFAHIHLQMVLIRGCGLHGVSVHDYSSADVEFLDASCCNGAGVRVSGPTVSANIRHCTIYRNKEGVSCRDGAEVNVVSTTFTEHVTGVHCSGDSSLLSLDNCNIRDGTVGVLGETEGSIHLKQCRVTNHTDHQVKLTADSKLEAENCVFLQSGLSTMDCGKALRAIVRNTVFGLCGQYFVEGTFEVFGACTPFPPLALSLFFSLAFVVSHFG